MINVATAPQRKSVYLNTLQVGDVRTANDQVYYMVVAEINNDNCVRYVRLNGSTKVHFCILQAHN